MIAVNPAGDVQVAPGSAPQVCAGAPRRRRRPRPSSRRRPRAVRGASRIALVWSEDDPTGGRHVGALASDLAETAGAHVAVYALPRTPNGRGVAQAWYAQGESRSEPPAEGEIGALIVSGDEAGDDPRVAELAGRARFVLTTAMFQSDVTAWSHVVLPGTSYLEREGTIVNLEGRPQRLRRAVVPEGPDELEWLAQLAERFGVAVEPWAAPTAAEHAELPPGRRVRLDAARPAGRDREAGGAGPRARPLHARSSAAPRWSASRSSSSSARATEVELAYDDAATREIAAGETVRVSSNGTTKELRARLSRKLRTGVVRIAAEHAEGLADRVQVEKAGD